MSPGAKVFLTLLGVGGVFGVIAIASTKKASASPKDGTVIVPPHDDLPPAVTPSEPESGFDRSGPFAVPGIQDAAEASRILLRWWAAEGQALYEGDTSSDKPPVPLDFGSRPEDLSGRWTDRTKDIASVFQHFSGIRPDDGDLTNQLVLSLRRWAQSQALPAEALPPSQSPSGPLPPIVLPSVPSSLPQSPTPPVAVPLPPIVDTQPKVVPVPPVIPDQGAPVPPVTLPAPQPSAPPLTVPLPRIVPSSSQPAPPQAPPEATAVHADTAAMVNALLLAEGERGWNRAEPTVQAWQKPRGLVVDGLFGPKTALAVAEEFGTVPIIRVWPKNSQKSKALQDYRAALVELASHTTDDTRAKQLRVSAQREQAQGYGVKRGTAAPLPESLQVQIAKVA